jgi:hypothetical protein
MNVTTQRKQTWPVPQVDTASSRCSGLQDTQNPTFVLRLGQEETHALQQTRLLDDLGQRGASVSAGAGRCARAVKNITDQIRPGALWFD